MSVRAQSQAGDPPFRSDQEVRVLPAVSDCHQGSLRRLVLPDTTNGKRPIDTQAVPGSAGQAESERGPPANAAWLFLASCRQRSTLFADRGG